MDRAPTEVASVPSTPLPRDADLAHLPEIARSSATNGSEALWLEQAQAGDAAAIDWLVRTHWERVQRLIVRMSGPRQDLEDLVQTTFLETLRALPGFRRQSAIATFICGIAVRVVLRARRPTKLARASVPLEEVAEIACQRSSPDASLDRSEALRRLHIILTRISEPKRIAFTLWAVEGMPVEEVAEAMQASLPATRSRIFYAQKAIKAAAARDAVLRSWLEEGVQS